MNAVPHVDAVCVIEELVVRREAQNAKTLGESIAWLGYARVPKHPDAAAVAASATAASGASAGGAGDGYCFDTNSIHGATMDGRKARYVVVMEFHSGIIEDAFSRHGLHFRSPFGLR